MKLLTQVMFQLVTLLMTYIIWRRFGWIGLAIATPIAFLIGFYGAKAKHRRRQGGN